MHGIGIGCLRRNVMKTINLPRRASIEAASMKTTISCFLSSFRNLQIRAMAGYAVTDSFGFEDMPTIPCCVTLCRICLLGEIRPTPPPEWFLYSMWSDKVRARLLL